MHIDRRALMLGGTAALVLSGASRAVGAQPVGRVPIADKDREHWLDVRGFGARGDGTTIDTSAFNRAIEAASKAGGGTVYVPRAPMPATRSGSGAASRSISNRVA